MALLDSPADGRFCVIVEFTPHSVSDLRRVSKMAQRLSELGRRFADRGVVFPAVSITQNPGGRPSYDTVAAVAALRAQGVPPEIEILPHVTGKDMNGDAMTALLRALADGGTRTILALTGDVPAGRGVFERDAIGILQLVREINAAALRAARSDEDLASAPQLRAGAAVSPFKYTDGSLAMQMIKASKKVRAGAEFLVCQSGWDSEKSERLVASLREECVPLIGNVQAIDESAARVMRTLPGCVITEDFLRRLAGGGPADVTRRAARQVAMFRQLGYAGVDLGRPGDFQSADEIEALVEEALAVRDWREFRDDLTFPAPESPTPRVRGTAAVSRAVHRVAFEEDGALHGVARAVLAPANRSADREGALYRLFKSMEDVGKEAAYRCEHCGDCFLPENAYVCTLGDCEKGLANVPCGDADPQGRCGNNPNRSCAGEKIYVRLLRRGAVEEFRRAVFPPRRPELRQTSSVLNRFFGRDHNSRPHPLEGSGMIHVGELIHASVPLAGSAMRSIQALGDEGFAAANRGRLAIEDLVATQAAQGADYIDLNIDALGHPDAPGFMRRMVRLVREHGAGVPPCVDSSDPAVLEAGLDEWLAAGPELRPPLVNSVTFSEMERFAGLLARRRDRAFSAVCLLVGPTGPLGTDTEMVAAARAMFDRCTADGFRPEDLFFDTVTLGIGTDGFMDGEGNLKASHTRNSFHAIRAIRGDAAMRGVHAILGVSNWVFGARKRRIGHLRAFIEEAREYGLDAVIDDVSKEFGCKPAPPELVDFVRMFVALDGGDASMDRYTDAIDQARSREWV
jgi:methylenetetrahydrofolate reductase (NADPH)